MQPYVIQQIAHERHADLIRSAERVRKARGVSRGHEAIGSRISGLVARVLPAARAGRRPGLARA
jgi:hypothetical protein